MTEKLERMRELYGMLMEELTGAYEYSCLACEHKYKNPDMAKNFDSIASDEMKHAAMLEKEIANIVKMAGADSKESTVSEFMTTALSDAWTKAKSKQLCYKGG